MNDRGESSTSGSSNVMSFLNDSRNKTVSAGFPTIESAIALWVEHVIHHEQAKAKAQEFADKMSINDFKASPGLQILCFCIHSQTR